MSAASSNEREREGVQTPLCFVSPSHQNIEMVDNGLPLREVNSFIDLHFPFIFLGVAIYAIAGILYVRSFPRLSLWQRISYLLAFNLCSADIFHGFVLTPQLASTLTDLWLPCPLVPKARMQLFFHPGFVSAGVITWCMAYLLYRSGLLHTTVPVTITMWLYFIPWVSAHAANWGQASYAMEIDVRNRLVSSPKRGGEPLRCPGLGSGVYNSAKSAAFQRWAIPACIGTVLLFLVAFVLPPRVPRQSRLVQRMPVCNSVPPHPPESTQWTFLLEKEKKKKKKKEKKEAEEAYQDTPEVVVVAAATDQAKTTHHHHHHLHLHLQDPDPPAPLHTVEVPSEVELGCVLYYHVAIVLSFLYMATLPSSGTGEQLATLWDRQVWALLLSHLRVALLLCVWALRYLRRGSGVRRLVVLLAYPLKRLCVRIDAATFCTFIFRALIFCFISLQIYYFIGGFGAP